MISTRSLNLVTKTAGRGFHTEMALVSIGAGLVWLGHASASICPGASVHGDFPRRRFSLEPNVGDGHDCDVGD